MNLLLNSKAAMPDGGTLTISSEVNDREIFLDFADTGVGIDAKQLNNIFDPFFTTKEDGTGLGLFISYEVITNHSGQIDVKSELGKGTTMTVRLPRIEDLEEEFED